MPNLSITIRTFITVGILSLSFLFDSCSLPNLEDSQCSQARDSVKRFYSWYLATNVEDKTPETYRKFISPTFLFDPEKWESDPYLLTNDFPTSFRVGTCKLTGTEQVELQMQLFWRTDEKNVQKEIRVESIKIDDAWLISKVSY